MTSMDRLFRVRRAIRFYHCDPAGIVYYPKYFDMFQSIVEDWFTHGLHVNYADFIVKERLGLPTVNVGCEFFSPTRMGEVITLYLLLERIGNSSIALTIEGRVGDRLCLRGKVVLVVTSLETHRAVPIPAHLRAHLEAYRDHGVESMPGGSAPSDED